MKWGLEITIVTRQCSSVIFVFIWEYLAYDPNRFHISVPNTVYTTL